MESLSNGLVTLANGLMDLAGHLLSPIAFIGVFLVAGFSWLCLIELDELDRQGTKPEVGRH